MIIRRECQHLIADRSVHYVMGQSCLRPRYSPQVLSSGSPSSPHWQVASADVVDTHVELIVGHDVVNQADLFRASRAGIRSPVI